MKIRNELIKAATRPEDAAAKNWEHAAGIVWPVLAQAAGDRKTLTYGEIAPTIKTNPLSVGRALGPIQDYCLDGRLPPLTAIVVSTAKRVPGTGFIAWDVDDLDSAQEAVFRFDWSSIQNPYGGYGAKDTTEALASRLVANPAEANDVYAKVKVRGTAQRVFRLALLKVYEDGCAFCGATFDDALDAAHIRTWQECSFAERLATSNGLLLCATHHRLFDAGMMTLSESYKVTYRDPKEKVYGPYSDADRKLTTTLHGKSAYLPRDKRHCPSAPSLRWHHQAQQWGLVP